MKRVAARAGALLAVVIFLAVPAANAFAAATAGRFVVDVAAKTVYDKVTKLTWQREVPAGTHNLAAAKSYCSKNTAGLAGSGWRLPNIQELRSLVDFKVKNPPAIDQMAFPNTPLQAFWSATPVRGGPSEAWVVVFFSYTSIAGYGVAGNFSVRCVR